jgi:hypothetical protein
MNNETYIPDFTKKNRLQFEWQANGKKLLSILISISKKNNFYHFAMKEARPSLILSSISVDLTPDNIVYKFWNDKTLFQIAKMAGISHTEAWRKGMKLGFVYKPDNTVKELLNVETGIYYDSIKDAARSINGCRSVLSRKIQKNKVNPTSFILI